LKKIFFLLVVGAALLLLPTTGKPAFGQTSATATPLPTIVPLPTIGGIPPPPPPPGGATATPVPASPTPVPTSTPVPLTIQLSLAHSTLAVGKTQKVTVTTLPGADVTITVTFPNHKKKSHNAAADSSGLLVWSFKQPAKTTTSKSRTVLVHGVASANSTTKSVTKKYKIK
jgi:hypothetical protein